MDERLVHSPSLQRVTARNPPRPFGGSLHRSAPPHLWRHPVPHVTGDSRAGFGDDHTPHHLPSDPARDRGAATATPGGVTPDSPAAALCTWDERNELHWTSRSLCEQKLLERPRLHEPVLQWNGVADRA